MPQLQNICDFLDQFAPAVLAAEWDNVGLLTGDPAATVSRLMTCLTVTGESAAEAIEQDVDLIVSHHPLPFHSLRRLTTDTTPGRLLWQLTTRRVAIYSPHTAFDSTTAGINQQLAQGLGLTEIEPLVPIDGAPEGTGSGRIGKAAGAQTLGTIGQQLRAFLRVGPVRFVGDLDAPIRRVAVACGAAGEFLETARRARCDLLVLGETPFHTCLEAQASGVALLLPGHYASERFAVERLADTLADQFPDLTVWASRCERDPLDSLP